MDIELFLAHADDHQPVLAQGIPSSAAHGAPVPVLLLPRKARHALIAPPDDLPEQGWAIIAPTGPVGDRLLRLVEPLRALREEQQGAEPIVYRVDPGMGPSAAAAWIRDDYWDAAGRREDQLPRYLLLLGDADLVSWDLQQILGGEAFVGRLAFHDERHYATYVEKVLRWEREQPLPGARVLVYTVLDGSRATLEGHRHLMGPSLQIARDRERHGKFPATEILEIGMESGWLPSDDALLAHAEQMLREAERARAGLLFSMSHGAGAPRAGWSSPEMQRALQGAMILNRSSARLVAADLASRPFLPGGLWFFFACHGAGTPSSSAYFPWLDRLHQLGLCSAAERVLAALPKPGESPFVAALPQAALANPDGPLGVLGHVDLAWTSGFLDAGGSPDRAGPRSRAERFQGILRALVNGHRFGVAHHELARFFRSVSVELSSLDDESARLGVPIDEARRAGLWMERQDLCAYVLLGDPAARLPIARVPVGVRPPVAAPRLERA